MSDPSAMHFEPLPKKFLRKFVEESDTNSVLLILTDGTPLLGFLSPRRSYTTLGPYGEKRKFETKDCLSETGYLHLEHRQISKEHSIFIPLEEIAGIHPFAYKQEEIPSDTERSAKTFLRGSVYEKLSKVTRKKARQKGFRVTKYHYAYELFMRSESFDWGNVKFTSNVPLYADWGYFQRISGGIKSIGVGTPIGSISAGWDKSLWALFKKKTKERIKEIVDASTSPEVVVRGFIRLIDVIDESSEQNPMMNLDMEGAQWIPGVICAQQFGTARFLRHRPWVLVYLRSDGFMFPKALWKKIEQPINFFAEVVPVAVNTEIGPRDCFLKIRAAAFVK